MNADIDLALQLSLLMILGVSCQWLAWRMRLPAILPLLLVGLLLGPFTGLLDPDLLLGDLLFPIVSLGVAIILFEGSLTLHFSEIRNVKGIIRNLTSVGVLVTWAVMGAAAHFIVGLDLQLSLLFGALVTVTGPTVIVPMLRSIQPTARIANVLRWEGILIDPIGAVLAVLVFEFILTGSEEQSWLQFMKVVTLGTVWGIAGAAALGQALKRHLLPDYLENFAGLAMVLLVFTASNSLGQESGLVAVTVMGLVLANMKDVDIEELLSFKEHLTVVFISLLFILLAARLDIAQLTMIGLPALGILAVGLFVARPLSVLVSSIGTTVAFKEGLLLAWIAPRGIVAAAISALFALKLEGKVENAGLIVPLTFVMIIGTVVIHGLTAGPLARRLGLSSQGEQGVLISSSNKVALTVGEALLANDIKVKVVDNHREGLMDARMKGMETFYGNPLSEHVDRYMDLAGYTHLFAMSRNPEANAWVCARHRHEFGPTHVFSIQPSSMDETHDREGLVPTLRNNVLFGRQASWTRLASLIGQGGTIRSTPLTEEYDFEAFCTSQNKRAVRLFALDKNGKLHVFSNQHEFEPEPGWTVVSLVVDDDKPA